MKDEIKIRVISVINKVTKKEGKPIDPNGDLKSQLNLDSIQLVELFAALEAEFDIELPLEMMMLNRAGKFMDRLEKELTSQESLKDND